MTDSSLPAESIGDRERQRVVDRLCVAFADDAMTASELERRLDLAYAARARHELEALVEGLPEPSDETAPSRAPAAAVEPRRPHAESEMIGAIMGGSERKGRWTPPRRLRVFALMGGVELDFREATFATAEVSVTVAAVMGGVEIVVPPGVRVEWNGIAIMGGFGSPDLGRPPRSDAPVIRINGLVLMAGLDVVERLPGESAKEARKRIKAERKAAKRLDAGP